MTGLGIASPSALVFGGGWHVAEQIGACNPRKLSSLGQHQHIFSCADLYGGVHKIPRREK
jgi:hypothetical protein